MVRVFVYGTLKTTEQNHYHLLNEQNGKSHFVMKGKTCQKYPLVAIKFREYINVPALLFDDEGSGYNVHGEVFEVDEQLLRFLDQFERFPEVYDRRTMQIIGEDDSVENCATYGFTGYSKELLQLKHMRNYSGEEIGQVRRITD